MMSFLDEAECRRFTADAAYLEISKDRKAGADAVVLLVQGVATKPINPQTVIPA